MNPWRWIDWEHVNYMFTCLVWIVALVLTVVVIFLLLGHIPTHPVHGRIIAR
jgi:hypothetical protein